MLPVALSLGFTCFLFCFLFFSFFLSTKEAY
jgi:hypothetical protein